jgi:hypothetical protein
MFCLRFFLLLLCEKVRKKVFHLISGKEKHLVYSCRRAFNGSPSVVSRKWLVSSALRDRRISRIFTFQEKTTFYFSNYE